MAGGDVCKTDAVLIAEPTLDPFTGLDLPDSPIEDCCYKMPVLAKAGGTIYENDKSGFLYWYNAAVDDATLYLQVNVGGVWIDASTLNTTNYGTFYAFGFYENVLKHIKYIGYLIDWQLVLLLEGEGCYRIKSVADLIIGGTVTKYSDVYELKIYTPERANGTVRFDFWNNGVLADRDNYANRVDFGSDIASNGIGWYNQIRLKGVLGEESSPNWEAEYVKYTNGKQVYLTDKQKVEYKFTSERGRYPAWLHRMIKIEMLQADDLTVTVYNNKATDDFIDLPVQRTSNYEPVWFRNYSKLASIELTFTHKFDNLYKKRC